MADTILVARSGPAARSADQAHVRRRLAPNVICMFAEDRPAVVQERRRGRHPRVVVSIRSTPRLMEGDTVEMCGKNLSNHGKIVRVFGIDSGPDMPPGIWWALMITDAQAKEGVRINTYYDDGTLWRTGLVGYARSEDLRRIWTGQGRATAKEVSHG